MGQGVTESQSQLIDINGWSLGLKYPASDSRLLDSMTPGLISSFKRRFGDSSKRFIFRVLPLG